MERVKTHEGGMVVSGRGKPEEENKGIRLQEETKAKSEEQHESSAETF